jgi:hypothetical protein
MDSLQMDIQAVETRIKGNWILENGKLLADSDAQRIDYRIKNELVEIGHSDDGWSVLYLDKKDGRYWELNYPDSNEHGGGAPCLDWVPPERLAAQYGRLGTGRT